jgi:hypothetical protein
MYVVNVCRQCVSSMCVVNVCRQCVSSMCVVNVCCLCVSACRLSLSSNPVQCRLCHACVYRLCLSSVSDSVVYTCYLYLSSVICIYHLCLPSISTVSRLCQSPTSAACVYLSSISTIYVYRLGLCLCLCLSVICPAVCHQAAFIHPPHRNPQTGPTVPNCPRLCHPRNSRRGPVLCWPSLHHEPHHSPSW